MYFPEGLENTPFTNKRWMVLQVLKTNTILLLLTKCNFTNKRWMVLQVLKTNTIHLLLVKFHLLFQIFLLIDTKKVNHLHDNNVNTEAKPRWYRLILLDVPWNCPGFARGNTFRPGEARRKVLLNSKEHTTVLPDTTSALPRY